MLNQSFSQPLVAVCLGCALAGTATCAAAVYCRRRGYGRRSLSRGVAASATVLAAGAMLAAAWWFGLCEPQYELPDAELGRLYGSISRIPPSGVFSVAVGDELPAMAADGWLNGAAPTLDNLAGKVIVVDIWNEL